MPYHITTSDANKIIFERDASGFASRLFVGVGSLFLFIGIAMNFFMDTWEMPFLLFRAIFSLLGAFAMWAGLRLPKQIKESTPEQITFDNSKGAVVI